MRYVKEEELGKLYTLKELAGLGVKPGDIVAWQGFPENGGYSWDYVLLRDGFPEDFNTALCCVKTPKSTKAHLYQIGFHWCGNKDSLKFRLINSREKNDFIRACIKRLTTPYDSDSLWGENEYAQIFGALDKYRLITKDRAFKLNRELEGLHGVNLLRLYKFNWAG